MYNLIVFLFFVTFQCFCENAYLTSLNKLIIIDLSTYESTYIDISSYESSLALVGIAVTPDYKYVFFTNIGINQQGHSVYRYEIKSGVITKIVSDIFNGPTWLAISPDSQTVYVSNFNSDKLGVIDVASNKVTSINLNESITNFIAINPKGDKLFFHKSVNEIGVLNLKDQNQIQIISSSHFNQPNFLSVSSDGTKLYVCNNSSPTVSVVDILTNLWICDITLPNDLNPPFIGPYYFALNPRQNRALVNNLKDLYLVNLYSNSVISKLNDENNLMYGIAFNSTGTKGYIVAGNKVEVFDSESNALVNPIELNDLANYIAITPIPYLPTFTQFLQRVCPVKYQRRL